jgi:hypothetical protein
MLSVKAIYDGKELRLLEQVNITVPHEVIITFLEPVEDISAKEISAIAESGKSFDFLHQEPDLYSDEDLKVKYK